MAQRRLSCSDEVWATVIAGLRCGQTLTEICKRPGIPTRETVHQYKNAAPERQAEFADARQQGLDAMAADCIEIAESCRPDKDAVAKAKLQIDTRLRLAAIWNPKRFGPKAQLALTDADGGPVQIRWARDRSEAVQDPSEKGDGDDD